MESPTKGDTNAFIADFIERAHFQSARTTEGFAPHQYLVRSWDRDDVTDEEFDRFAAIIRAMGQLEEWTPPEAWRKKWPNSRPMKNRYLYVSSEAGEHAYWFTWPRNSVPMINREATSVQLVNATRRVIPVQMALPID